VLVIEAPLSFAEAALGAEIDVPVLDGLVRMRVPPGTQSGALFRLRGKGFPRGGLRSDAGARGDAHVRVVVETPGEVSDEARALLDRLGATVTDGAMPRRSAFRAAAAKPRAAESSNNESGGNGQRTRS
jgi:molecular chaperone DnaJ